MTQTKKLPAAKARSAVRTKIVSLRQKLGVGGRIASRQATARVLDVSPGSIYNWERAGTVPHRHAMRKIDAILTGQAEPPARAVVVAKKPPSVGPTTAERLAIMADAIARCGGVKEAKAALDRVEVALA